MPAGSTIPSSTVRIRVGRTDALAGRGPHSASAQGLDVVLVRTEQGLRAFQGRCPHQGALLGEGEVEGQTLVCRNHRWRFRIEDGCREGGPECLVRYPITEEHGEVFVDVPSPMDPPAASAAGGAVAGRTIADLKGPPGWPVVGNLLQLDLSRLHEIHERWAAEYGPVFRYRFATHWVVVVADPVITSQVLRARPETFRRLSTLEPIFQEMGVAGVFSAEGSAWRPQRQLAMEALSPRHQRGFYPQLRSVATRMLGRWEREAAAGESIDIVSDLKRFTVDITTLLTFGCDVNTIDQDEDVIQRRLEHVFPALNRRLFALFPTWRVWRTPSDRRLDRALAEIRVWLDELVRDARARMAADPSRGKHPSNFLEAMLAARDDAGRPFDDGVIFGNLMTMLLAGEDTTAYTLGWAVHHLCDSPASVSSLERELDAVLGTSRLPEDFDAAQRLAYAGAIANEAMRLRPVAPLIYLQAIVDTRVGDLEVPAETVVAVLTRPPAVDARNFERPEVFLPDRWITPVGAHEPAAHIPFGSGPRLCPGRTLALLEMKVVLAALYRNFAVARDGAASSVREDFAFTMSPVGLRVRLRKKDSSAC